ncbi:IPT/TIG domain-containing protein [Streptomyces sp. NPDC006476]|uniref:IPT/TIG domain-containing protein n=1 Tax=Streptomyces sp. NPDC006476 TaxID=3157175 RepID=UPI00339FDE10
MGVLVLALAAGTVSADAMPPQPRPSASAKDSQAAPSHQAPSQQKSGSPGKAHGSSAAAEPTTDNAVYAYDAAGRLVGVTDPAGQTARYRYDKVGNRLGIDRFASNTLSVLSVVPVRAVPGAKITLSGTGFSTTAANNNVTIGGKTAAVTSAFATRLTVTVPANAVSGKVAVTAGGSTAEAAETFTVASPGPTISAVAPVSGVEGTQVTLTGTGFASAATDNLVRFNAAPSPRRSVPPTPP